MFALLFGYGIVQLLRRHTSSGVDELTVRRLVRRRGWWMVLIGFFHAMLLFSGDIIGAYGLLAVLLAEVLTPVPAPSPPYLRRAGDRVARLASSPGASGRPLVTLSN
jgi:hypothetical protein